MECDDICPDIFENDCNKDIVKCLMENQMSLFKTSAYIVRRGETDIQKLDKGNFFYEDIVDDREYIPITISVSRLRDDGTKDDKDQMQITEEFEAYYTGTHRINRTDMILYQGSYYDCRDLFTQEWNDENDWIYQKFKMSFIQEANDLPDNIAPSS